MPAHSPSPVSRWSRSTTGRSCSGPAFCVGVNGLVLGYLFYKSGLVPRWMAIFGLVGGPLIFASAIAVLFGAYEQDGAHFIFSIPEIIFEFSITIFTIVKGFRPSPILAPQ